MFDEMLRGPDCILWKGGQSMGYGIINVGGGQPVRVHRFVYLAFVGPIPAGRNFHVHHKCRTKLCINLDHLEVIENGAHQHLHAHPGFTTRTECINGHPLTPANVYMRRDNGKRQCKECGRTRNRLAHRPAPILPRPCERCGLEFTPRRRRTARWCSNRCEARAYYQEHATA